MFRAAEPLVSRSAGSGYGDFMTGPQRRATGLVAVSVWLTLDLVRFSGPLISQLFDVGVGIAAAAAIAAFVGGGIVAFVGTVVARQIGYGRVLVWTAAALVVLRVLLPFLAEDALIVYGLIALALALGLVLMAAGGTADVAGGAGVLAAAGTGAMVALLEQGVLRTWDALWRDDVAGWIAGGLLCFALLAGAWRARGDVSERPLRGLWAFGLWFSILAFGFANVAFLSSQTGFHLGMALVLGAFGLAAGIYAASRRPNLPVAAVAVVGAVSLLATWTTVAFSGAALVVMTPVASATVTYLASRVVRSAPSGARAGFRSLGGCATFGLMALLPFMLVQIDYDIPIGIPHLLVIVIAAGFIAAGAIVRSREGAAGPTLAHATVGFRRRAGLGVIAAVGIGAFLLVTFNGGEGTPGAAPAQLKIVSWNLHYGVTPGLTGGPAVDLDATVDYLRAQDADILLLQEVERGWVLAGGTDLLEYLANSLHMYYVYAGAHDRQFGNAILSRYPITDPSMIRLPYGAGPQGRSAIIGTVATSKGPIQLVSVHLQHKDDDATRVAEVEALLAALGPVPSRVVAGDFNDTPDSRAVALMLEAGYTSAQDALWHEQDTYVGSDFNARIDYQFLQGVSASSFGIGGSDHLNLAVTVAVK
jgi:endonuclease/exonuclease/phosphatase family metal-dependent hydrolase